jgi:DNA-binding response OmpR family regulator
MKKILVMDDTPSFGDLLLKMFAEFEVLRSQDAAEGIRIAIEQKPDVILLGMAYARMSPVEILRRLQLADETTSIPVIMLTDKFFDARMQRVLQREPNVFAFLDKTTSVGLVIVQIQQILAG